MGRGIIEFLNSGDVENIVVGDNLIMAKADDPAAKGLVMTIGDNGQVVGRIITDSANDVEWYAETTTDIHFDANEVKDLVSVTVDEDIAATEGVFQFYCKIDNNGRREADVTLNFKVNGQVVGTKQFPIAGTVIGYPATFWGRFGSDRVSGDEFTVEMTCDKELTVVGSIVPVALKIIKTPASTDTVDQISALDFSKLPTEDPHIKGRLWVNRRGSLRVSQG